MKLNKTPEINGIPNIELKAAIGNNTELLRQVFDAFFQEKTFPKIWKRQTLVLIPKGKHAHVASRYRPLCMIDTRQANIWGG